MVKVVCYAAIFSVVTKRSFPQTAAENRTTFFPAVSQLEFSSHFLEGVRATFAVR